MFFLLHYDYVDNIVERRAPFRDGHLSHVGAYVERGEVLLGGAYANPVDGATIVFKADQREDVERFVNDDPYFVNGLVKEWHIREWSVVVGSML